MHRIVVHSRVGPDGVLVVQIPLGHTEANQNVTVIVESIHTAAIPDSEVAQRQMESPGEGDIPNLDSEESIQRE